MEHNTTRRHFPVLVPDVAFQDFRLLALEHLGDENALLKERVQSLEDDTVVLREQVSIALEGWNTEITHRRAAERTVERQSETLRELRAQVTLVPGRAA